METKLEQFNKFSGGITSNLRTQYENPKYAKLWNFIVSEDRAIQQYGWKRISTNDEAAIVEALPLAYGTSVYTTNADNISSSPATNQHITILPSPDASGNQVQNYPEIENWIGAFNTTGNVDTGVVPKVYNNSTVYKTTGGDINIRRFFGQGNLDNVLPDVDTSYSNTFLVEGADNILYVFSGKSVHGIDMLGKESDGTLIGTRNFNVLSEFQPITEFMQLGDIDGQPATYTVGGIPVPYTITQVRQLQQLLSLIYDDDTGNSYYSGDLDGEFGADTRAAVLAFQSDFSATGDNQDGQNAGDNLVVDGLVGPETSATLSKPIEDLREIVVYENIFQLPYNITAVQSVGGSIVFATKEDDGHAKIYVWDLTRDTNGKGDIGLLTFIDMGLGTVQWIDKLHGEVIACMSPFAIDVSSTPYSDLMFYKISTNFNFYPESGIRSILKLKLRQSPDRDFDDIDDIEYGRYNAINRKTIVFNDRIYFSGRLHIQTNRDTDFGDDEGAMSGVFSIDINGNFYHDASVTEVYSDSEDLPSSFGLTPSGGFWLADAENIYVTEAGEDQKSGLVTKIINGGQAWRTKAIENIYVAIDQPDGLQNIEVYLRELSNKDDNDAGWVKVYDGQTKDERRDFKNRVIINRNTENMERFEHFRELQVMVIIDGNAVELVDLTIAYNMLDLNK